MLHILDIVCPHVDADSHYCFNNMSLTKMMRYNMLSKVRRTRISRSPCVPARNSLSRNSYRVRCLAVIESQSGRALSIRQGSGVPASALRENSFVSNSGFGLAKRLAYVALETDRKKTDLVHQYRKTRLLRVPNEWRTLEVKRDLSNFETRHLCCFLFPKAGRAERYVVES